MPSQSEAVFEKGEKAHDGKNWWWKYVAPPATSQARKQKPLDNRPRVFHIVSAENQRVPTTKRRVVVAIAEPRRVRK